MDLLNWYCQKIKKKTANFGALILLRKGITTGHITFVLIYYFYINFVFLYSLCCMDSRQSSFETYLIRYFFKLKVVG